MFLELERSEEFLLSELVRTRLRELEEEQRTAEQGACEACGYERAEQLAILGRLLHRLREAEWDVTC